MPNKVTVNKKAVKRKMVNALKNKSGQRKIYDQINKTFQRKKRQLINDYEQHPVTQEIQAGPTASNSSGTLMSGYGNLYTFIGFEGGDPTKAVSQALRTDVRLNKKPTIRTTSRGIVYSYSISFPTVKDLKDIAPMPWEPGSWVERIERGISGLGYYLYQMGVSGSRSGGAVQTKGKLRSETYKRTKYMSAILKSFRKGWTK
jgi:hypothetical protein